MAAVKIMYHFCLFILGTNGPLRQVTRGFESRAMNMLMSFMYTLHTIPIVLYTAVKGKRRCCKRIYFREQKFLFIGFATPAPRIVSLHCSGSP